MRVFAVIISVVAALSARAAPAHAQQAKLGSVTEQVKSHVAAVIKLEKAAEARGRRIAGTAVDEAKSRIIAGKLGARRHPWEAGRDPGTATFDYFIDSYLMTRHDQERINRQNYIQVYGCHEAGLLAYSKDDTIGKVSPSADVPGLAQACRAKCPNIPLVLGFTCISNPTIRQQLIEYLFGNTAPLTATTKQNGYELAEYWFPEYQVSMNDYGMSRLNPAIYPPSGPQFTRQALMAQKNQADREILRGLSQEYSAGALGSGTTIQELAGHGAWGGFAWPDYEEKSFAHVYRTWQAWQFSNNKLLSRPKTDGWKPPAMNPLYTFADGFPPMTIEHEITNIWMEWGIWDMITSIPQFSYNIPEGKQFMEALYGPKQPLKQAAATLPPFWQSTGAMSYRAGKWPVLYRDLSGVLKVSPAQNKILSEVVYQGGYELYPLVMNASGFAAPALGAQVHFARRAFELAGLDSMAKYYPPSSGPVKKIMRYTIDAQDPSREIDKLQLIYPRKQPLDGPSGMMQKPFPVRMTEGLPNQISECFRSQKIPSMIDQTQDEWAKRNFPADLQGYVMDPQILGPEGKDVSVAYWNHRIDCSCDICGIGAATANFNRGGDLPKEPRRVPVCKFGFGHTYSALVGEGKDKKDECNIPGFPEMFEQFFMGLNDRV